MTHAIPTGGHARAPASEAESGRSAESGGRQLAVLITSSTHNVKNLN
jgi:hypothetical protein